MAVNSSDGDKPSGEAPSIAESVQSAPPIRFEKKGCAGVITLDRPAALNALNDEMRSEFEPQLQRWAVDPDIYGLIIRSENDRVFCVGGDVRELYGHGRAGNGNISLSREYSLNWRLERYTKPTVSLINGMVMGSGVGITQYGTHRVAGENYRFSMPEAGIGFFPDVGASWFLSHMDDEIGTYLGLTGLPIDRADAFALGLATHVINSDRFDEIERAVSQADPIDPVLDELHEDPGAGEITGMREVIRDCFSASSLEEIIERVDLVQETGSGCQTAWRPAWRPAWREETLDALGKNSPTSLKVILRQLREGRALDLRRALQMEYRLATFFLSGHDFYEGVRAHLIDKDHKPVWEPQNLSEVRSEMVAAYFEPAGEDELVLAAPADDDV